MAGLTEAELTERVASLSRRAKNFKSNEKQLFSSGKLFDLYGVFLSIWRECEEIVWDGELPDRIRMLLMDIQEDVYTHFLLSSLGYLPLHAAETQQSDAAEISRDRAAEMAIRFLKTGQRFPHLSGTLETYRQIVNAAYDVDLALPELE